MGQGIWANKACMRAQSGHRGCRKQGGKNQRKMSSSWHWEIVSLTRKDNVEKFYCFFSVIFVVNCSSHCHVISKSITCWSQNLQKAMAPKEVCSFLFYSNCSIQLSSFLFSHAFFFLHFVSEIFKEGIISHIKIHNAYKRQKGKWRRKHWK